ncbi:phosphatidate cytidylyltransferase [Sulfurimonas sp. HSL-3221]|uniref:phosphatidate cytidylyltransferase n=1 Tax=Sulfurimonadaceae TaxID=2771471 RepID=UPI001E63E855|nr:phosphatidate cytidylyltransferase [Sulfurimonas sp. HSL-3221]UFS62687.1 phosphatidate cytidylyltransferase [Sulfurimonas sp. HSL-3221]
MAATETTKRVVTGAALIGAVILLGWIDNFILMWAVLGGVYLLAFYEAANLYGLHHNASFAFAAMLWLLAAVYPYPDDLFVLMGVVFAAYAAYKPRTDWRLFLPFAYPTAGMLFFLTLYQDYGLVAMAWLIVVVAAADIGAYVVGKSIGKTKFSETSPNKTLEGVVGGIVIATIAGVFVGLRVVNVEVAIAVSLATAISAVFGDLYESYLKRRAGVKDSGNVLPGHGGVLDRIDGYLFGAVVMVILLRGLV